MRRTIQRSTLILVFVFLAQPLAGQQDTTRNIDDYYIDFAIPDLGAFTLLNTKPDNIATPGSVKEFAASLLNVVSGGTTISPGLAIDWSPIKTFCKNTTPQEYKKSYLLRNLQVTLGTIGDSTGTKIGAGLKWTFIDDTDPLLDNAYGAVLTGLRQDVFLDLATARNIFQRERNIFFGKIAETRKLDRSSEGYHNILRLFDDADSVTVCTRELMVNYSVAIDSVNTLIRSNSLAPSDTLNSEEKGTLLHLCVELEKLCSRSEQYHKDITEDFGKAKKRWLNDHWNATVMSVGAGWVGISSDGKWSSLKTQIFKTYLIGKFRVSQASQAIGMLSYSIPLIVVDTDSTITSKLFVGGRFLIGNASNRLSFDLGYGYDLAEASSFSKQTFIADIAVEFKLNDGVFLEIAGGFKGEPAKFLKSADILALGSLKYALQPKARFGLPE